MRAVILVPFRGGDWARERNWRLARRLWREMLPIPVFLGDSEGEFSRARARNAAAEVAGEWDVALFVDADILLDSVAQAEAAIMRCYRTGAYTVAHSVMRYITEYGVRQIAREQRHHANAAFDEEVALTWECCYAVRRDVWDEVGGFDERFEGYGGQGIAFYYAAATLAGQERIHGFAYHLPHELVDRDSDPHFQANVELTARYFAAVGDQQAMRELLKEAL